MNGRKENPGREREDRLSVKVTVRTRVKKFDGDITPGKAPVEIFETEERTIPFRDLPENLKREVRKRWE